ncbi:MAG: peptidylprolyl isomerase [Rhodoferax sp.]|jgi:peptidyl-prolyl cis-trans isomerase SurA|nr:peptidylprolyl isomerase [Rhodoferax sp.]
MMTRPVLNLLVGSLLAGAVLGVQAQAPRATLPAAGGSTAGTGPQRSADYIVAIVNSEPITNHQVRQEAQRLARQLAQSQQQMPDNAALFARALERLINERAQLQQARDTGIRIEESSVDEAEANVARQNQIDLPELQKRLAADGIDRAQFRKQLREQLMLVRVRERDVNQKIKVSELEIDQYLREQQKQQGGPATDLNISHVLIALPEDASAAQLAAAQAQAQRVIERARAGEDFSALARELSAAADARSGGQFGLRPVDRYPTLFVDTSRDMAVGDLRVVRSGAGLHVLKLIEKRVSGMPATTVEQTLASHILLRPSAQLSEAQARERLNGFRTRIVSGQVEFAALAREFSQDGSASQGGELGWAVPGQFVPEFEDVMNALAPGEVSEPFTSRFGVHLMTVKQRRVVPLTPREQREAVRGMLREKKVDDAFATWAQELRARAYVEMRDPPG